MSGLAAITDALKSYRPAQTVLEAEVSRARGPLIGGTNTTSAEPGQRMMLQKRAAHSATIAAAKRGQTNLQASCIAWPIPLALCRSCSLVLLLVECCAGLRGAASTCLAGICAYTCR